MQPCGYFGEEVPGRKIPEKCTVPYFWHLQEAQEDTSAGGV